LEVMIITEGAPETVKNEVMTVVGAGKIAVEVTSAAAADPETI